MPRPLFQGLLHLSAALIYALLSPSLLSLVPSSLMRPMVLYLIGVVGHFAVSALLHIPDWSDEHVGYIQALDHIMIFAKFGATYYAAVCTVMHDVPSAINFMMTSGISLGILFRILWTQAPNVIIGAPYVILGWIPTLYPSYLSIVGQRMGNGAYLAVIAGLAYTIGAIIYITRRPRPCDKYLGYHELFHVLTIIGAGLFSVCIFGYAIPYYQTTIYDY